MCLAWAVPAWQQHVQQRQQAAGRVAAGPGAPSPPSPHLQCGGELRVWQRLLPRLVV